MPTYVYAPTINGTRTVQGAPWTAPDGVTLAAAWGDLAASMVDVTALTAPPTPGSTYANGVFTPPIAPTPTNAQAAAALQAGGLTLTSTSTPALNAVYALDYNSLSLITSEELYVVANGSFSNGQATLTWIYAAPPVTFPSVAAFKTVSSAIAQTITALQYYGAGVTQTAPNMSVTVP